MNVSCVPKSPSWVGVGNLRPLWVENTIKIFDAQYNHIIHVKPAAFKLSVNWYLSHSKKLFSYVKLNSFSIKFEMYLYY